MGPLTYLLDSTLLIDAINKVPEARAFLVAKHPACCISPVTRAEVLAGASATNQAPLSAWLSAFAYLALDPPVADLAATLRRERRWKLPDAFQAALALHHGLKLVTRNTKDFNPAKHPFVVVPYRV